MATPSPPTPSPVSSSRRPLPSTAADKIAEGERLRDEGLTLLKEDKGKKAAIKFKTCFAYTRGLLPLDSQFVQYAAATGQQTVIDGDQQGVVRALELACNEALATIYFRRGGDGDHGRALAYGEKVLRSDPENLKGLFRAGQLHLRLRNIEAAKRCLTKAAKKEPQNVAIRSELRNLSKLAQESGTEAVVGATSSTNTASSPDAKGKAGAADEDGGAKRRRDDGATQHL